MFMMTEAEVVSIVLLQYPNPNRISSINRIFADASITTMYKINARNIEFIIRIFYIIFDINFQIFLYL